MLGEAKGDRPVMVVSSVELDLPVLIAGAGVDSLSSDAASK